MRSFKLKLITFLLILLSIFLSLNATIAFAEENYFFVGGFPLGFDLSGEGALVVGLAEVICEDDIYTPAKDAGIKTGDYILSLNGKKIQTASDIDDVLNNYSGGFLIAEILSDGQKCIKNIYPQKDLTGKFKLGILIRDYLSGLGTVTMIDQNGNFCSLGHPIIDESGKILGVGGGFAYGCQINGIVKGERGKAGELKGSIIRTSVLGTISKNSQVGILGNFSNNDIFENREKILLGNAKPGNAEIYTTVNGDTPKKYCISIIKVDQNEKTNKNMVIKITDQALIKKAGGIVQGMSGSPVIQDGRLVGAVTHVFLNDSTRGYAISINKMTENMYI